MPKMRAVQVSRPGGPLELVERPVPDPGPGQVRIQVSACGICGSDALSGREVRLRRHGLRPRLARLVRLDCLAHP